MKIIHLVVGRPKKEASNGVLKSVYKINLLFKENGQSSSIYFFSKKLKNKNNEKNLSNIRVLIKFLYQIIISDSIFYFHGGCQLRFIPLLITLSIFKKKSKLILVPRGAYSSGSFNKRSLIKKIYTLILERFLFYKPIDYFQCLNENEKVDLKNNLRINEKKIKIIPSHSDYSHKITKEYNIKPSKIKLIYVGRIDWYMKGLDEVYAAVKKIKKSGADIVFDIFGPIQFESMSSDILTELNDSDFVNIHDPVYDMSKLKKILDSDIFILCSRSEGLPNSLIEALSLGMKVICTNESNLDSVFNKYVFKANLDVNSIKDSIIKATNTEIDSEAQIKAVETFYCPNKIFKLHKDQFIT